MTALKPKRTTRAAVKRIADERLADALAVRERLTARVLTEADEIIDRVIEAAKTGNYLPAKFLFEFAGILEPLPAADAEVAAQKKARSLAEVLIEALQAVPKDKSQETSAA